MCRLVSHPLHLCRGPLGTSSHEGLTVGDAVGQGHDADGEEGRDGLGDVVPVDLGRIDHHQGSRQNQRRARAVHRNGGCRATEWPQFSHWSGWHLSYLHWAAASQMSRDPLRIDEGGNTRSQAGRGRDGAQSHSELLTSAQLPPRRGAAHAISREVSCVRPDAGQHTEDGLGTAQAVHGELRGRSLVAHQ